MREFNELKIAVAGTGYVGLSIATSSRGCSRHCAGKGRAD